MNFLKQLFKETVTKPKKITYKPKSQSKDVAKIASRKGELGEYKIDIQLAQLPKEFKHLSDIQISNSKAKSGYSQIDHIVISSYGIFVIETKNYQGTVYGDRERKTWSVNGKFKMMNPFIQNYGHIQALKKYIDTEYHQLFISMVSFTKRCTFKIDDLLIRKIASNDLLVYDVELFDYINRKISVLKLQHKEPILKENEIHSIHQSIERANISDPLIREHHVESLREGNKIDKKDVTVSGEMKYCTICRKAVSEKVTKYCLTNTKFNGKIYCFDHQK